MKELGPQTGGYEWHRAANRLTLEAETSYAKSGVLFMADPVEIEISEQTLNDALKEQIKEDEKKREHPKVKEFKKFVDELKNDIESGDAKQKPQEAYAKLHQQLSLVKMQTSPVEFIKAVVASKVVEWKLKVELQHQGMEEPEIRQLKIAALSGEGKREAAKEEEEKAESLSENQQAALKGAWLRYFSKSELADETTRQAIDEMVELGQRPDNAATRILVEFADEFVDFAELNDDERIERAEELLHDRTGRESPLSANQVQVDAITAAVRVLEGQTGKDGEPARFYNSTTEQMAEQDRILIDAGFTEEEMRYLRRDGLIPGIEEERSLEDEELVEFSEQVDRFSWPKDEVPPPPFEWMASREKMVEHMLQTMGWESFEQGQQETLELLARAQGRRESDIDASVREVKEELEQEEQGSEEEDVTEEPEEEESEDKGKRELDYWLEQHGNKSVIEVGIEQQVNSLVGRDEDAEEPEERETITETLRRQNAEKQIDEEEFRMVNENAAIEDDNERIDAAWDVLITAQKKDDEDFTIDALTPEQREEEIKEFLIQRLTDKRIRELRREGKTIPDHITFTDDELTLFRSELETAIIDAHEHGMGEDGKDGNPAEVYNFTHAQLVGKARFLTRAGFSREDYEVLMKTGITGGLSDWEGLEADLPDDGEDERPNSDEVERVLRKMSRHKLTPEQMRAEIDRIKTDPHATTRDLQLAADYLETMGITRGEMESVREELLEIYNMHYESMLKDEAIKELQRQGFLKPELTQDQINDMVEKIRPTDTIPKRIENLKSKILTSDTESQVRNSFIWLQRYVKDINDSIKGKTLEVTPEVQAIIEEVANIKEPELNSMGIDRLREMTQRLLSEDPNGLNIKRFFIKSPGADQRRGRRDTIQSLEELVELISQSQGGDFAPGKKFEVLNERGEVQLHNLIAWIRSRIIDSHNYDPDSEINVFSQIRVPMAFREVGLGEMLFIPAYFQKRKVVIYGTEKNAEMREENVEDAEYNNFKNDLLVEAWLFGESHNYDAAYRLSREREDAIFETIAKLYAKNQFTKGGSERLRTIFSLARMDDKDEMEGVLKREKQGGVGKAIARGLLAYNHLNELVVKECDENDTPGKNCIVKDQNRFIKTLEADGMKYFYQSIIEQLIKDKFGNEIDDLIDEKGKTEAEEEMNSVQEALKQDKHWDDLMRIIGSSGITRADLEAYRSGDYSRVEDVAEKLMNGLWKIGKEDLNIFDVVTKPDRITNLVHNALSEAVGKKEGLSVPDSKYAGYWAFTMRNWTGIAAKNDTTAIGFDAWSKLINFGDYRVRQFQEREMGGNPETLWGIRSIGLSFVDGLIVTTPEGERKSLLKVLEENAFTHQDIQHFDVEGQAQKQFAGNHINRGYQLLQFILDKQDLKLDSIISSDKYGNVIFDRVKAQEIMGGPFKYMRYAFDQLKFPMEKGIHGWYKEYRYDEKSGTLKADVYYEEKKYKEYFFRDDVLNMHMYPPDYYKGEKQHRQARNLFAYMLMKEMKVHREWGSTYQHWNTEAIQEIEAFFSKVPTDIGIKRDSAGQLSTYVMRPFFTHHDWQHILQAFDSPYWKMFLKEYGIQASAGFGLAFLRAFQEVFKQAVQLPKS